MVAKNYSEEFRRQAVDLYESTPGATVRGIARDLGISQASLYNWLARYGSGRSTPGLGQAKTPDNSPEARIAALEAEVKSLRADKAKLATERDILRQAAKYFAGETRW